MMTDENGILSIDFLAGFTIFMLAFIWVVSMIPGLMVGLQSYTIDYDAVAYRTGVILVEDPGWSYSSSLWEFERNPNVTRLGLAVSKDTPNILSQDKIDRFFNISKTDPAYIFRYPDEYRTRAFFGVYGFNVTLIDLGGQNRSVGDVLPEGYGYIRRPVKIKGVSYATINNTTYIANPSFIKTDNATTHVFSILINNPKLRGDITDPAYQIDPMREQIIINITDLKSTIREFPPIITQNTSTITLRYIRLYSERGSGVNLNDDDYLYVDGSRQAMPVNVADNVTLKINPLSFSKLAAQNIYITLGFEVTPPSTFLNNTQVLNDAGLPDFLNLDVNFTFNNPNTTPFYYDYNPANVTQPYLRDAVVEVAVWSGAVTSYGGVGTTPINGTHTIYASAGIGGTISPIGSVSVSDGANQLFTITNNTNYHITNVVVDGASNGTIPSYTFTNVNQDHTIAASFAIDTYTITPSVIGGNGTISPATVQTVNYGATPTFTITPINAFYHITDVSVNGISVGTVTSYTFPAVSANYTINASFALGPAPSFTSITPASGPTVGGTPVTIVGTNFVSGGSFGVTIGGAAATSVFLVDSSHITAVTPAGTAGAQDVVIVNNDGQTATAIGAYTYVSPPTFTSITPVSGPTGGGTNVTIVGTNFVSGGSFGVTIGGAAATSVFLVDSSHITAVTPAGTAGAKNVVITNNDGQTATGTNVYTYVAGPTFTSIAPAAGPIAGGTTVIITGTGFTGATVVTFGGTAATAFTVNSAIQITATTPAHAAGAVNVVVTTPGGTVTGTSAYTYAPIPTFTSIAPAAGPIAGGTTVIITGTGFTGATVVTFGGTAATAFTVNSAIQITATTPAHAAGAVNVVVTTPGGTVTGTSAYTYVPLLVADFTWVQNANVANPHRIRVTDASTGGAPTYPVTLDWNWNDATAHGSGSPVNHNYASSGSKTVTLIVTRTIDGATSTITKSVTAP